MAESIAEGVVSSAIQKLGNLLLQEVLLLYGVRDQVKWVETELRRMQCFLKDADAKRGKGDERVKKWMREVIDVSYRAEDVIDTFLLRVERRRRLRGILPSIKRYALIPADLIASHKVGVEIKSIRDKIRDISESRATYGIANLGETVRDLGEDERLQALRRISPDISGDMDAIVGFHDYGEKVVSQLLDADMKHRCVISIVGMGGLGKTTLAKKVYNSHEISLNFPTRVWVTVSSDFKPQELVKSIARKAMSISRDELEKMEEDELEKKLCDFLKERRYLIVMDDIWTTDVWRMINAVLPDVTNGSRVLFTTRFVDVSKSAAPNTNPFMLPLLNNDESWELFSKKVFPRTCFPKELEELGQRMAKKCGGLPLALKVLGGILSTKDPTPIVWMQIKESMDWGATSDGERCMQILALSYRNLPHLYLKSCFLYIASFPEDSEIYASELIRLWIAEGFIPEKEKEEMEDTARGYLDELVKRSMIQVVSSNYEGVLTCRIHDLLREMGIAEAKQDRFFSIIHSRGSETTSAVNYESNTSFDQNISSSRRLVLHNLTNNVCSRGLPLSNTRSLLLHSDLGSDCVSSILQGLKLLRVLHMHHTKFSSRANSSFPMEIKFMTHLRYLKLSNVIFSPRLKLPSSIGKLSNLQTIDLEHYTNLSGSGDVSLELPKELGELPNLRHLLLPFSGTPMICPPFTTTKKLQTLVNICGEQQWMDESLTRLTSLRRLAIKTFETGFHSLSELTRLVELSITSYNVPIETIFTMVSNNDHLHKLKLVGKLETRLPEINRFPRNLTELWFHLSEMEYDPMPILEKLPNLVILELYGFSYNGMEMVCTAGGFPKLGILKIVGIKKLENWIVEVGAFPKLWSLSIWYCQSLTMLPDGLQHVTSLRELIVWDERKEFRDRLRKDVGEDWHKMKHVPSISVQGN